MAEKQVPGGFLGAGGFLNTDLLEGFLSETVTNNTTALLAGEVCRIFGNDGIARAQANLAANVVGLAGVTLNAIVAGSTGGLVTEGKCFVLLEAALVPVAGNALWVSAATAGRATNVAPAIGAYVGIIKDASIYAATGGVIADIDPISTQLGGTLAVTYATGSVAADQTMVLTVAKGGSVVINGTDAAFMATAAASLSVLGKLTILDNRTIAVPAALSRWGGIDIQASTLTLTGGAVAPTQLSLMQVAAPTISGAYTIPVAASLRLASPPVAAGGATLTRTACLVTSSDVVPQTLSGGSATHGLINFGICALQGVVELYNNVGAYAAAIQPDSGTQRIGIYTPNMTLQLYGGGVPSIQIKRGFATGQAGNVLLGSFAGDVETYAYNQVVSFLANKTIITPVAGSAWDGVCSVASTCSLTMGAGAVAITALSANTFQAPIITANTGPGVPTIADAAAVTIEGPPTVIAGTATPVITRPWSLWVKVGSSWLQDVQSRVLSLKGAVNTSIRGYIQTDGTDIYVDAAAALIFRPAGNESARFASTTGNFLLGTSADANAASKFQIQANKTIAVAAGMAWDGVCSQSSTCSITMGAGAVAVTALSANTFQAPIITGVTDAGIPTIANAATVTMTGAPTALAGTALPVLTNASILRLNATVARTLIASQSLACLKIDPTLVLTGPGSGTATKYGALIDLSGMSVTAGAGATVLHALKLVACTDTDAIISTALTLVGRVSSPEATPIASTADITLTRDGNVYNITGTNDVKRVAKAELVTGDHGLWRMVSTAKVVHGTAGDATWAGIVCTAVSDIQGAGNILTWYYDGTVIRVGFWYTV